ncbi:MAG: hypothetical protein ABSA11_05510 [Candidatus Bathyarchaeia archaeon]|jgi:hypothetical protein
MTSTRPTRYSFSVGAVKELKRGIRGGQSLNHEPDRARLIGLIDPYEFLGVVGLAGDQQVGKVLGGEYVGEFLDIGLDPD